MSLAKSSRSLAHAIAFATAVLLSRPARAEEPPKAAPSEGGKSGATTWLVASGAVLFGGTYLISFGMASAGAGCGTAFLGMDCVPRNNVPGSDWPLFVPVVGPFVAMGTSKDRPIYALALLGAGQVVGAALLVSALAVRPPPTDPVSRVSFSPSLAPTGASMILSSRF
jgi:hypothetical protein